MMRRVLLAIFALIIAGYFALRFLSGVTVDQPVESKEGLIQRAAAAQKLIRYNAWRTGWIGGSVLGPVILWPIAPTDGETAAAGEFASAVVGAQRTLRGAGFLCGVFPEGRDGLLSDEEKALIGEVAAYLRAGDTIWAEPATVTLMVPIRAKFPCGEGEQR